MREETKELLKDNLVKINKGVQKVREKVGPGFIKKTLVKLFDVIEPKLKEHGRHQLDLS
jgi:hypothetical protein